MDDWLENAKKTVRKAERAGRYDMTAAYATLATAYAAIAQVEELKRIADALERERQRLSRLS